MRQGRLGEHAGLGKIGKGGVTRRKEARVHGARIKRTGLGKIGESGMARNRGSIMGRRVMVKSYMGKRTGHSHNFRELVVEMLGLLHRRLSRTRIERKARRSSILVIVVGRKALGPERRMHRILLRRIVKRLRLKLQRLLSLGLVVKAQILLTTVVGETVVKELLNKVFLVKIIKVLLGIILRLIF